MGTHLWVLRVLALHALWPKPTLTKRHAHTMQGVSVRVAYGEGMTTMRGARFTARERVRVAFLGTGGRGRGLLRDVLACDGIACPSVDVVGVFDVSDTAASKAASIVVDSGSAEPSVGAGDNWRSFLDSIDADIVYIASPWEFHVPMALDAMERGMHAAIEVPAATTIDECWALVDASERTGRHAIMLENCCYGYEELLLLNLVRAGKLGTLTHGEAAYIHDLRSLLLSDHSEGLWRRAPHVTRDANLYPTHGLGPIARCLGIHDGDRFTTLVSMSSKEASLTEYRDRTAAEDSGKRGEVYRCGDMNTSLLKTALGRTVMLQHDVATPRPYSRGTLLQGTKGAFRDFPAGAYFDGDSGHDWKPLDDLKAEFEHPLWSRVGELAKKLGGHGGMDFLMSYRLMETIAKGDAPEMDVYDAAAWSAPTPLSEMSVAGGSIPIEFPDFTRGNWREGVWS